MAEARLQLRFADSPALRHGLAVTSCVLLSGIAVLAEPTHFSFYATAADLRHSPVKPADFRDFVGAIKEPGDFAATINEAAPGSARK